MCGAGKAAVTGYTYLDLIYYFWLIILLTVTGIVYGIIYDIIFFDGENIDIYSYIGCTFIMASAGILSCKIWNTEWKFLLIKYLI